MKKIIGLLLMTVLIFPCTCFASGLHDMQDNIGTDKFAHAACSYVICDQLQRAGMNKFWATTTTLAIGAAKEGLVDDHWDGHDFAADCAGVLMWNVKF